MTDLPVRAAGGVLWRTQEHALEVALVHRPRYDDWSLPKGKAVPGELLLTCALREVMEETGYDAVPGRPLGTSRYLVTMGGKPARKKVSWWALRAVSGAFRPSREVDRMLWLSPDRALRRMSSTRGAAALRRFTRGSPRTHTLLLVSNGRVAASSSWPGSESARPLHAAGRRQAEALTALLAAYRPEFITSAAPVRCVETVTPLTEALDLPVEIDPALTITAHTEDPARTTGRVRELMHSRDSVVVCSEREVVKDVVRDLTGRRRVSSGRGSTWALSMDRDLLAGADYWAS
jgi:8-oxo-dGTP diphosphatase